MIVKLQTEHHLEVLSLKGGSRGSSESTLVKCQIVGNHMPGSIIFVLVTEEDKTTLPPEDSVEQDETVEEKEEDEKMDKVILTVDILILNTLYSNTLTTFHTGHRAR